MKTIQKIKIWARQLKHQISTLYLAYKHPDTPFPLKIFGALIIGYALSPIDLIPDFIPVLGYIDDLVILPVSVYFFIKFIPENIWEECKAKASNLKITKNNWLFAGLIVVIWCVIALAMVKLIYERNK